MTSKIQEKQILLWIIKKIEVESFLVHACSTMLRLIPILSENCIIFTIFQKSKAELTPKTPFAEKLQKEMLNQITVIS